MKGHSTENCDRNLVGCLAGTTEHLLFHVGRGVPGSVDLREKATGTGKAIVNVTENGLATDMANVSGSVTKSERRTETGRKTVNGANATGNVTGIETGIETAIVEMIKTATVSRGRSVMGLVG